MFSSILAIAVHPYVVGGSVPIQKLKQDTVFRINMGFEGVCPIFSIFPKFLRTSFVSKWGANLTLFIPDNVNKIGQMGQDVFKLQKYGFARPISSKKHRALLGQIGKRSWHRCWSARCSWSKEWFSSLYIFQSILISNFMANCLRASCNSGSIKTHLRFCVLSSRLRITSSHRRSPFPTALGDVFSYL